MSANLFPLQFHILQVISLFDAVASLKETLLIGKENLFNIKFYTFAA